MSCSAISAHCGLFYVILCIPHIFIVTCHSQQVDIAYFPFDDQVCHWKFGSWIYSGAWIDFNSSIHSIYLDGFIDNSEWDLRAIRFDKSYRHHPSSGERHPDLLFTLHIRRRTLYYMFNIIAPCVMLSVLTLLTFWLPPTSGEKISLGLSVFLAFSMFMLLIAEEVPATSESVPLIGQCRVRVSAAHRSVPNQSQCCL